LTAPSFIPDHDNMLPPSRITSRQNPRVKEAAQLRTGRERQRQGRFLVEGVREIERALAAGVRPVEIFVCDELCDSPQAHEAARAAVAAGAEPLSVAPAVYAKLAFGDRDEGLVLIAHNPNRRLPDLQLGPAPLVAVLEGIEKPGNLGAILRSADAAGVDAVIVADPHTDLYNPNSIRASLGTVFRANVCTATAAETILWLTERSLTIVAARPDAVALYTETDLSGGVAIVLGSEAAGLGHTWRSANVKEVRLPMHGLADSLNVSTTAAVLFYEALRQRSKQNLATDA
jgi:TrmH family RNA methyltransferase